MARRRSESDQQDSLELLLDTVSNVFGGVMFLTLLAALLIIARGSSPVTDDTNQPVLAQPVRSAELTNAQLRQTAVAIKAARQVKEQLDPRGDLLQQADELARIQAVLARAQRHASRSEKAEQKQMDALRNQQAEQSEIEDQIAELENQFREQSTAMNQVRAQAERTVEFRPLRRSVNAEVVIVLRYGRWYSLNEWSSTQRVNTDDFFVIRSGRVNRVTPKPHRGNAVTPESLDKLVRLLKRDFPAGKFTVTIAVWDDSFTQFNPLKDAVKAGGYKYRTLTCDVQSQLTNNAAVDSFVQ